QVTNSLAIQLPPNPSLKDLPIIKWKNRRFVLEQQLSRKRGRGRSSWIQHHGFFLVELIGDQPRGAFWCCSKCDERGKAEFFGAVATTSAAEHLRK
ncbi:hypothetical protein LZ30DRAFT_547808, partial [Colletotrichum cereale]